METDDDDDSVFQDDDDQELNELLLNDSNTSNSKISANGPVIKYQDVQLDPIVDRTTHHAISYENLNNYIYPTNFEVRDYQYNIVQRAFYDNLLVTLPTGLGKTFIASTVMLNFLRWFPYSKLIFMAPTRPLVAQQIKACCGISGIPSSKVAILLDKSRKKRNEIWDSKNVFFTTPQVVENDLASGIIDPKSVVLLVIDEAHRAKGNYSYNNVVKFLKRFNNSYRILALTATPASDVEGVQEIINNLDISKVEVRTENSIDILKYLKHKRIVRKNIAPSLDIIQCINFIASAISPVLQIANERKIYDMTDPTKINFFQCMDASQKIVKNPTIPEGLKWSNFFILKLLGIAGQCYRRLNIYGIKSFYSYFKEQYDSFSVKWNHKKSTNKINADFFFSESIKELMVFCEGLINDIKYISHPKLETLIEELETFFEEKKVDDSKVIIFTEFRESALDIVTTIESMGKGLRPHIFIGQSKEKAKFDEEQYLDKIKKRGKSGSTKSTLSELNINRTSSEDAQIKGMNQKLQKEIIKKFNHGEYNILVATSIGEEGLDIGEVDLIVCYDSTSSPIKNIQRMGRTGRKRDGKVLLLFSSNEESKFDKAMGGYEYIQNHIMKKGVISLAERNRIIPSNYEPVVEFKFIEIPEENLQIKAEEDEDEIIKLATNYMLRSLNKKPTSKTKKSKKIEKKFFMPDGVETGFRTANKLVNKIIEENLPKLRDKDTLDKILSSESEGEELALNSKYETSSKASLLEDKVDQHASKEPVDNFREVNKSRDLSLSLNNEVPLSHINTAAFNDAQVLQEKETSKSNKNPHVTHRTGKTLGLKRRKVGNNVIDQLKLQQSRTNEKKMKKESICVYNNDIEEILSNSGSDADLDNKDNEKSEKATMHFKPEEDLEGDYKIKEESDTGSMASRTEEDDVFDDGLDDVLISIDKMKLTSLTEGSVILSSNLNRLLEQDNEYVYPKDKDCGLLSERELAELYTLYFTTIDPADYISFYEPFVSSRPIEKTSTSSRIGYGKASKLISKTHAYINQLSTESAIKINRAYAEEGKRMDLNIDKCINYIDDITHQ